MDYNFSSIEKKWQKYWEDQGTYKVPNNSEKEKCYVLDMFPYPSGAGLHVGHPLGYIASDIYARYKRLQGFNVLHPMGFDAFGLPAEQYALETGQHPAKTTETNIKRYKEQLNKIGFCYDWSREVNTSEGKYYKWTQWLFLQLYGSWYDKNEQKARDIEELIKIFEAEGNISLSEKTTFSAEDWKAYSDLEKQEKLMQHRLAYKAESSVNWCEALGTVLANDEVINGRSERGNHPVEKKKMSQWFLRITAFADRLLNGLDELDYPTSLKEMQRNWIGKSQGARLEFKIENSDEKIEVFTTRPDTIFGVSFMVLAPEHTLVSAITTTAQQEEIEAYKAMAAKRSERERMTEVKNISGAFTGAYAIHPLSEEKVPIWIADYVLAGYGTGAIMAVPAGDERDYAFAKHFSLEIPEIFDLSDGVCTDKEAALRNSQFLDGQSFSKAFETSMQELTSKGVGQKETNYRLRDAGFSRQRYWGEPFPILFDDAGLIKTENNLPLELPHVETYSPGPNGQGPLANITDWVSEEQGWQRETDTMPGYAASSWYYLRYMDPHNENEFCAKEQSDYWGQVDVYVGGAEHAVGHLLYSRMWCKFLHDRGYISFDEPYKKLINQGMIQGDSRLIWRVKGKNTYVSAELAKEYDADPVHVSVELCDDKKLDLERLRQWRPNFAESEFIMNEEFLCTSQTEKMSKTKYNVVNPDDIIEQYGADTFRMYEMFLGPIELSKPWDTKGIEGVHRFIKKLWKLFYQNDNLVVTDEEASKEELKSLHQTIKKTSEDIERFAFNTAISQFMICVNELGKLKCSKRSILEPLLILLAPFAPHLSEELWAAIGHDSTILDAKFPILDEGHLKDDTISYPIAINGKVRATLDFAADDSTEAIEKVVLSNEAIQKHLAGKEVKKVIHVKGRMINVVI